MLSLGLFLAWMVCIVGNKPKLALVYLLLFISCLGCFRHFVSARLITQNDVRHFLSNTVSLCKFKGYLQEEPKLWAGESQNPLRTIPSAQRSSAILFVQAMMVDNAWQKFKGNLKLVSNDSLTDFHLKDSVEVIGRARLISPPANPGEWDYLSFLNQQGIYGEIKINSNAAIILLDEGPWFHFSNILAKIKSYASALLLNNLPEKEGPLAEALLLGDSPLLHHSEWDKFKNTGVLHVLAISGQHLAILGGTLAWVLRALRFKPSSIALIVTVFLFVYALLTGGRPSAMRAAIMVGCFSIGTILRRPTPAIHAMASAWVILAFIQPWDLFTPGCILSFLATGCLIWVIPNFMKEEETPLDLLTHESKPLWRRMLLDLAKATKKLFFLSAIVWIFVTPVATAFTHVVSPVALLLGPPLIILTTLALFAGFIAILVGSFIPAVATLASFIIYPCLWLCSKLVDLAMLVPLGHFYLPDIPLWLTLCGYFCFIVWLLWPTLMHRYSWIAIASIWVLLFLIPIRIPPRDLCITFLAVGHGTCVVIETPSGKVIVYDAGSISGPEVSRRKIAPFLWSKKITRIDKLIISHADLDHFNGLPFLLESFNVVSIATTPSFSQKLTPGVELVNRLLTKFAGTLELYTKGKTWSMGDVEFEVLHPPEVGPIGNENTRSMVLQINYKAYKVLLTGDLQTPGLEMVLAEPMRNVDVLMAPHHGSKKSLPDSFLDWANPSVLIGTQGDLYPSMPLPLNSGVKWLSTQDEGAISLKFYKSGIVIDTFLQGNKGVTPSKVRFN